MVASRYAWKHNVRASNQPDGSAFGPSTSGVDQLTRSDVKPRAAQPILATYAPLIVAFTLPSFRFDVVCRKSSIRNRVQHIFHNKAGRWNGAVVKNGSG